LQDMFVEYAYPSSRSHVGRKFAIERVGGEPKRSLKGVTIGRPVLQLHQVPPYSGEAVFVRDELEHRTTPIEI
jgi:hypothetical protein